MENRENKEGFARARQVLDEFELEEASIFYHAPVLRIQVPEAQFSRAIFLRETLVRRIKPLGYRFIAIDLFSL